MWFVELANPTTGGLLVLVIVLPIGFSLFHFFSMVPVCLMRQKPDAFVSCLLLAVFNIGPLCQATQGIFSGGTLALLWFAFYIVFVQLFFVTLKKAEVLDGLDKKPVRINKRPNQEQYKLLPIYFSNYSYNYTASAWRDTVTNLRAFIEFGLNIGMLPNDWMITVRRFGDMRIYQNTPPELGETEPDSSQPWLQPQKEEVL